MEKTWIASYDPGVVASLETPDTTFHGLLQQQARAVPDTSLCIFPGRLGDELA